MYGPRAGPGPKTAFFVKIKHYLTRKVGLLLFYLLRDRKVTNSIFVIFCQILSRLNNRTKCQHYVLFMPKFMKVDQMVGIYRLELHILTQKNANGMFGNKIHTYTTSVFQISKMKIESSILRYNFIKLD